MELVAQLYASRTVTDFYAHDVYQDAAVIITQTYSALNARHLQAFLIGMLRESNGLERDQRVELFQRVGDMLPMFFWEGMVDEAQNLPEWLHCVLAQCDTVGVRLLVYLHVVIITHAALAVRLYDSENSAPASDSLNR